MVEIYTDGACKGNPGPGGWGALLKFPEHEQELSGGEKNTTNNRMELMAAIMALESLAPATVASVHTDSEYVKKGITEWLAGWMRKGWKTASGQPVKNQDLWQRLYAASQNHTVQWHWVKGHAGHPGNERADRLASAAAQAV